MIEKNCISNSVQVLHANILETASVQQWAQLMGYSCPKKFAREFQLCFHVRPNTYLKYLRLKYISMDLRENNLSNFEIARKYGVSDEIALNKYINYHLNCSPTKIKTMEETQFRGKIEKLGSKIR